MYVVHLVHLIVQNLEDIGMIMTMFIKVKSYLKVQIIGDFTSFSIVSGALNEGEEPLCVVSMLPLNPHTHVLDWICRLALSRLLFIHSRGCAPALRQILIVFIAFPSLAGLTNIASVLAKICTSTYPEVFPASGLLKNSIFQLTAVGNIIQ